MSAVAHAWDESAFRSPYGPAPGSSTPSAGVTPKEGIRDLWSFFWLALLNTLIIGGGGVVAWVLVHRP